LINQLTDCYLTSNEEWLSYNYEGNVISLLGKISLLLLDWIGREAVEQIFTVYLSLYWKFFLRLINQLTDCYLTSNEEWLSYNYEGNEFTSYKSSWIGQWVEVVRFIKCEFRKKSNEQNV
jgi:hypothetical protein